MGSGIKISNNNQTAWLDEKDFVFKTIVGDNVNIIIYYYFKIIYCISLYNSYTLNLKDIYF